MGSRTPHLFHVRLHLIANFTRGPKNHTWVGLEMCPAAWRSCLERPLLILPSWYQLGPQQSHLSHSLTFVLRYSIAQNEAAHACPLCSLLYWKPPSRSRCLPSSNLWLESHSSRALRSFPRIPPPCQVLLLARHVLALQNTPFLTSSAIYEPWRTSRHRILR